MDAPDIETACREVILEWRNPVELAFFAEKRHGYGNSDGGFGIIYPEDLDEYQVEVEKIHIPKDHLLVYGYAHAMAPGYELLVLETKYLSVLAQMLTNLGLSREAARVSALVNEKNV